MLEFKMKLDLYSLKLPNKKSTQIMLKINNLKIQFKIFNYQDKRIRSFNFNNLKLLFILMVINRMIVYLILTF